MDDEFDDYDGLIDDDPALDYILYEDMVQEGEQKCGGCFGVAVILILPIAISTYWMVI